MGEVIHVDFLFVRLCRQISRWYDKYYFGKDIEARKQNHLSLMQVKYEEQAFSEDHDTREEEIKAFLTMVQRNVEGYI